MNKSQRNTLNLEQCEIISHEHYDGAQHLLRLKAPQIAAEAKAGSFVHLKTDPTHPLRRPISIMRVSQREGWIELLYKVFGEGTGELTQRKVGEKLSLIGPIGKPFTTSLERPRTLLIGGGVGMPPMVFLADQLREMKGLYNPFVILGSEVPFPFTAKPSKIVVPGIDSDVIGSMPLLEDWGVPSRMASKQGYPGCLDGYVTDLARQWLNALDETQLKEVEIFSCGPHPMLEAVAALAKEYSIPCQVSMEEFMACGIGGCAGCVIEVQTDTGPEMKRVCVDGPVFDATQIFA
ncbi:MAG: dihydroorotate dehydrogenase electron transfer subunit [Gammaproteobacteria bacterium]|nr:dihydroorotate dehydrogenase electron transfer subunit [Gammaproteobacteria bacterium]